MRPILTAPRVILRPPSPNDVPALFAIYHDPATMAYWSRPPMTDPSEAEDLIAEIERHAAADTLLQWIIARREDDLAIGSCTLFRFEREHRRAEIGYILRRDHWGRGLATEALEALFAHAFGALGLHRLEADVDPRNVASIRLVERLGFKREGHLRERYFVGSEIQDSAMYGLLAREWVARR
jgi:RimJ/RimL family protein N-acetyltransferase